MGVESGDTDILKRITKGASPKGIIKATHKAKEAGIKVSATVILGLGGQAYWQEHIAGTAALMNEAAPNYLSTLQLHLDPVQEADFRHKFGEPFEYQSDDAILVEQETLLQALAPRTPVIFRSNHASNALPLAGTLPKDKDRLLATVAMARQGKVSLRPQHFRGV